LRSGGSWKHSRFLSTDFGFSGVARLCSMTRRFIPFEEKAYGSLRRTVRATSTLRQGFVFVNFDRDVPRLSKRLGTLDKVLAPFKIPEMKTVPFYDYPAPWNWKHTIENFSEAYHQPPIHPETFEPWCPAVLCRYEDVDGPYNLFWMPTANGGALPTAFPPIEDLPENYKSTTLVVNVFPYFHLLIDPACIVWLDINITGAQETRNIWRVMVPPSTRALPDFEERNQKFLDTIRPVWDEDTFACTGAAAGARSQLGEQGRLSWMKKSIHQFQLWLVDRYTHQPG
jgi:hypothetical protein